MKTRLTILAATVASLIVATQTSADALLVSTKSIGISLLRGMI